MTREKISIEKIIKECPKCGELALEFFDFAEGSRSGKYFLKCTECGLKKKESFKMQIKEGFFVALIDSSHKKDKNFWLIADKSSFYAFRSKKAEMPRFSNLPNNLKYFVVSKCNGWLESINF